jgi:response regulator RpfG family c-di-GMP phosphodiesterase
MQPSLAPHTRPSVLVVDDESYVRDMLASLLEERYQCDTASDVEQAITLLGKRGYQLVLSDINMPGRSGLELLSEVTARNPNAVVVMISGSQNIESVVGALRRGAFDYIIKPFTLEAVELTVERALKHQALLEANRRHEQHLEELVEEKTSQLRQMNASVNAMFEDLYLNYRATLSALASALEKRDAETRGHSQRVVAYCLRLGQQLGLSGRELVALEHGALLHDIGKIGVPDAILLKPGALSPAEWQVMRLHIEHGADILHGIEFLRDATLVVTQHHEKWDGSGYPLGLKGEQIALNARIFAVADAVDAITSDRPYRAARSFVAATAELLSCSGTHFDPRVVAAFLAVPLDEWQEIRDTALASGLRLDDIQRRGVRSLILSHKTGRLELPAA